LRPYEESPGLQAGRQQLFSYAPIASALDVIFKTLQDVSVLEIGAGNVCFFHYLRDKGASPSILDADYMEYKMGVKEGMDVHEGDVTEMHKHPAFRGRRFDVVVTNNVFSRGSAKATKAILSDENIPLAVRNISEKVRVGGFYIDYRSDMAIVSSYLSPKKFRVIMKEDRCGGLLIAQRIK
jgi:hypothetical protein